VIRIIAIFGVLLIGLGGLLMSACGGFFLLASIYSTMFGARPNGFASGSPIMLIAAIFLALGGAICWSCFNFIRRRLSPRNRGDDDPK
jgi:drug/metabolite transporter (DMT)-like permease